MSSGSPTTLSHAFSDSRPRTTAIPAAASPTRSPPHVNVASNRNNQPAIGSETAVLPSPPFTKWFHQKGDPEVARARKIYLKIYVSGLILVIATIFAVFSIYWGSLWKVPSRPLKGWIVDFDGGQVGQSVVGGLLNQSSRALKWEAVPASQFSDGIPGVIESIKEDQSWVAVVINANASSRLQDATVSPTASYNGSQAITVYGAEARNENAYRNFIKPVVQATLDNFKIQYATNLASQLSSSSSIATLLSISPQTVVNPVSYTIVNLLPFDQPVASAVTFVGLIYLLILAFYIVMIAHGAREASGINKILRLRSLLTVRLVSALFGYFFLSLFYSLLNLAFRLNVTRRYGRGGFMIFWMLNWVGMLSVGMALESLITVLTPRFIPFFMILWIICNVSVCVFPIEVLPRIYHYGYGAPFYNVSNSVRSLAFGTRNTLGLNFGVLFAWVVISCTTLVLLQWYVREKDRRVFEGRSAPSFPEKPE